MNRLDLIRRVRSLTRDFSNSIFRESDIVDYINEGINRIRQVIPELSGLTELTDNAQSPDLLPKQYHHLLALYSASRCFGQDERHYQASNFMNEFETKLDEMKVSIEEGRIKIIDPQTNQPINSTYESDYVVDNYFKTTKLTDFDDGVEGVK